MLPLLLVASLQAAPPSALSFPDAGSSRPGPHGGNELPSEQGRCQSSPSKPREGKQEGSWVTHVVRAQCKGADDEIKKDLREVVGLRVRAWLAQ